MWELFAFRVNLRWSLEDLQFLPLLCFQLWKFPSCCWLKEHKDTNFFSNMYFFDHQCLCLFVLFSCLFVFIFYNSLAFKMGLVHFLSWLSSHRSRWPLLKIFLLLETLQQLKASCQLQQIVRLRWTFYKHPELTAEHQFPLFHTQ